MIILLATESSAGFHEMLCLTCLSSFSMHTMLECTRAQQTAPKWWCVLHVAPTTQFKHMLGLYCSVNNLLATKSDSLKSLLKPSQRQLAPLCSTWHPDTPQTGFPLPLTWWRGKLSASANCAVCLTACEISHCRVHTPHTPSMSTEMSHCHYLSPVLVSAKKLTLLILNLSISAKWLCMKPKLITAGFFLFFF